MAPFVLRRKPLKAKAMSGSSSPATSSARAPSLAGARHTFLWPELAGEFPGSNPTNLPFTSMGYPGNASNIFSIF
jgi:hypothetical protein